MKYLNVVFLLLFVLKAEAQKEISTNYIGFYIDKSNKNKAELEFEIRNLTKDTIYVSEENLNIKIYRNTKEIKEEIIDYGIATPFIRPRIAKCPEMENIKNTLASKFSTELVQKNNIEIGEFRNAYDMTLTNCIVLFPNEIIYYKKYFTQKTFDKDCEVEMKYKPGKIFAKYKSERNTLIEIKR
jgi:hypothetical protein